MSPAEHYAEAEKLLMLAEAVGADLAEADEERLERYALAAAQVHATLATVDPRYAQAADDLRPGR